MENSAVQSRGSISSISTSNQTLDPNGAMGPSGTPDFVNHGFILWNQTRQHWLGNKRSEPRLQHARERKLSWNVTYQSVLGSNKPFPQPVPLGVRLPTAQTVSSYSSAISLLNWLSHRLFGCNKGRK
ncbi:hypothetical protein SAY86_002184 [Trapa natans]|uniref:Gag1-like clamp domain-containing protein n=1 Tax=Trapa natans TaxID=22666 RepID=A0AAN7R280_TRANT|nr:hypothetical protein SAY86_002184 [Trapa natans]